MGVAAGEPLASRSLFLESEMRMPWGARELTGTSNFTRHVSVYDNIVGHLVQGGAYVEGTIKTSSWDHGDRGHCKSLSSNPKPDPILPCCDFPQNNHLQRPCSNTTSSMKPSQMFPVKLPCFLPHLFSANSPSITALTCLNVPLPRPESDVPSSLHLAEGLVQDRNTVTMAILLNC